MKSKVYFSKTITAEKVLELYRLLGVALPGKVAIKVHSGEEGNQNFLRPAFWKPVVEYVGGTVTECNTAYKGARNTTEKHLQLFKKHGWSEHFDFNRWQKAFADCGVEMERYTRARETDELLPWEVIDCGVSRTFLLRERDRAQKGEVTPNCREKCSGCGAAAWKAGVCHA